MERREKTFPITIQLTQNSRFEPRQMKLYYAHEWKAYQEELAAKQASDRAAGEGNPQADAPVAAAHADNFAASQSATQFTPPNAPSLAAYNNSQAPAASHFPPDFYRHARKCSVCNHPDRDAIEADFIRWRSPEAIATSYEIPDRSSIYRHAHATGLFPSRKRELPRVLESVLECVGHISLDSMDVITRAARVYAHLDDDGKWFEPPKTMYIFAGSAPAAPVQESPQSGTFREAKAAPASADSPILIATPPELENEPTP